MNTRIPQSPLILAAATLCLAGCVTVPMAPLVYGSKTVGGLDISTTTSTTNPGVSISIGYKRDDVALVPVAVLKNKAQPVGSDGKGGEHILIIHGDDANADASDGGKETKAALDPGNRKKDSMSVFGSFEGRGMAGADATSAQAVAANYFSTGIAAQHLAAGIGRAAAADQIRRCFEAVRDIADKLPADKQDTFREKGLTACSEAGKPPATAETGKK